uniref:Uncharacterized protein n=1 Tax=Oryza meridionalis TaxID=40149 RepID=A0A0E0E7G6_9ORYZ
MMEKRARRAVGVGERRDVKIDRRREDAGEREDVGPRRLPPGRGRYRCGRRRRIRGRGCPGGELGAPAENTKDGAVKGGGSGCVGWWKGTRVVAVLLLPPPPLGLGVTGRRARGFRRRLLSLGAVVTMDLLGGCGGGGEDEVVDLEVKVPAGWERRLHLMSGQTFLTPRLQGVHVGHQDLNLPPPPRPRRHRPQQWKKRKAIILALGSFATAIFIGWIIKLDLDAKQKHLNAEMNKEKQPPQLDDTKKPNLLSFEPKDGIQELGPLEAVARLILVIFFAYVQALAETLHKRLEDGVDDDSDQDSKKKPASKN